jgi:hypothetical protein
MLRHVAAALLFCVTGCATASSDASATSGEAESTGVVAPARADVETAIASLDAQRNGDRLGKYYADGNRVEGCWRNPVGNKLSDLQKAFYCAMPLELRLCNSVELLAIDESKVDERYDAYLACQKKVDAVFGGTGEFVYDDNINAVYKQLFLNRAALSADDTAGIVTKNKPTFTDRSFTVILLEIGAGLASEAGDLAVDGFMSLVNDYKNDTKSDPR